MKKQPSKRSRGNCQRAKLRQAQTLERVVGATSMCFRYLEACQCSLMWLAYFQSVTSSSSPLLTPCCPCWSVLPYFGLFSSGYVFVSIVFFHSSVFQELNCLVSSFYMYQMDRRCPSVVIAPKICFSARQSSNSLSLDVSQCRTFNDSFYDTFTTHLLPSATSSCIFLGLDHSPQSS